MAGKGYNYREEKRLRSSEERAGLDPRKVPENFLGKVVSKSASPATKILEATGWPGCSAVDARPTHL
jgi:hypothetical protein